MIAELLGRRRILIVEDDWVVALDMSDMVEELGGGRPRGPTCSGPRANGTLFAGICSSLVNHDEHPREDIDHG
jgi:uncharacterized protein YjbJ (UPF0337 family)